MNLGRIEEEEEDYDRCNIERKRDVTSVKLGATFSLRLSGSNGYVLKVIPFYLFFSFVCALRESKEGKSHHRHPCFFFFSFFLFYYSSFLYIVIPYLFILLASPLSISGSRLPHSLFVLLLHLLHLLLFLFFYIAGGVGVVVVHLL